MVGNIGVLLISCLIAAGLIWTLQGVGRGTAVLGLVQDRARQAYGHLLEAQQALAETDFAASEQAFTLAQTQLGQAEQQLATALAGAQGILHYLDVTGTVRSGEDLLTAGQALTEVGQHISRGLQAVFNAGVLPQANRDGDRPDPTLVDGIVQAQQEFNYASSALSQVEGTLQHINSSWLPVQVAAHINSLRAVVPPLNTFLQSFQQQSDLLLKVLGASQDRQYLLLFANNNELRPVGGFIGSIALVNVNRGIVEKIDVRTVYDPDGQLKEFIAPPDPLLAITNRWYMRDANWFVDYRVSARKIADFFEKEGGPTVDGVVLLTPDAIRPLLALTGPISVPGYEQAISADNFAVVLADQVTYNYDKQVNRPKQFLADLAPVLLRRLLQGGSQSNVKLLTTLAKAIAEKNLLLYFRDSQLEEQIVSAGWGGTLPSGARGFLAVNNANIGGHKSDQFIEQEIDYRSQLRSNGDVDVVVTVRRTHHGPQEVPDYQYPANENPAFKDNVVYQRVLVPAGAKLLDAQGFATALDIPHTVIEQPDLDLTADADVAAWQTLQQRHSSGTTIGQEAGYTFFANWVVTKPGDTTVTLYHYVLPGAAELPNLVDPAKRYTMYIAKQAGERRTTVRASLSLPGTTRIVHTVPDDGITLSSDHDIVYRGSLKRDLVVGAVFENN